MLNLSSRWAVPLSPTPSSIPPPSANPNYPFPHSAAETAVFTAAEPRKLRALCVSCGARRRVRYEEDEEAGHDGSDGYNSEIAKLEIYSQSARGEALIVHTVVDEEEMEVLVFKGFSSCLSQSTVADPSRSVVPARAVIKSIDRIKGPFDPSNIEFIEKGLSWDSFEKLLPT